MKGNKEEQPQMVAFTLNKFHLLDPDSNQYTKMFYRKENGSNPTFCILSNL